MKSEKEKTLEERFAELEMIIEKMEKADVTLDQSFELYKQGVSEVKAANELMDTIEKAILVLNEEGQLEEF